MVKGSMRYLAKVGWGLCWIVLAGLAALAQSPMGANESASRAVREIDDPHSGARWVLVKDAAHPGGPGRLVPVEADRHATSGVKTAAAREADAPVIHAGDRILVEEHTEVVDAVLEAVALGPAPEHGALHARLRIGGRVVRVVAVAAGRATLSADAEAQP
jgi:hypothetical protein